MFRNDDGLTFDFRKISIVELTSSEILTVCGGDGESDGGVSIADDATPGTLGTATISEPAFSAADGVALGTVAGSTIGLVGVLRGVAGGIAVGDALAIGGAIGGLLGAAAAVIGVGLVAGVTAIANNPGVGVSTNPMGDSGGGDGP